MSRRQTVRLLLFLSALVVVSISSMLVLRAAKRQAHLASYTFRETVLCRMAEESAALCAYLDTGSPEDVRCSGHALSGYASLLSASDDRGAADAAVFCRALASAAEQAIAADAAALSDLPFWRTCAGLCADALAELALAAHPMNPDTDDTQTAAILSLRTLAHAFQPDPLRLPNADPPAYTFDGEPAVTSAEARLVLSDLLGTTARFLRSVDTDPTLELYRFSCENGYAELSVSGGHLLRYALHPRTARSDAAVVTRALSDPDLESLADTFLRQNGIPLSRAESVRSADLHGIRVFFCTFGEDRTVTVGIRQSDGMVMSYDSTGYYRKIPSS